jgi:hypothetical protein
MKLVLRACAAPLRPAHLAFFLKDVPGTGMALSDAPHLDKDYHDIAMEAMRIQIVDDVDFANAVKNLSFHATKKPVSKLTPRNQFLAIAPKIVFAGILTDVSGEAIRGDGIQAAWVKEGARDVRAELMETALDGLFPRPFVMGLDLYDQLEKARVAGAEAISSAKLQGFVEQHLGTPCIFSYEA